MDIPACRLKREIVRILLEQGFLKDVVELPENKQGILRLYIRYNKTDDPMLNGIQRISRPGLRRYCDADWIRQSTFNSRGMIVVSTSSGVVTNLEASKKGIGGEILLRCW